MQYKSTRIPPRLASRMRGDRFMPTRQAIGKQQNYTDPINLKQINSKNDLLYYFNNTTETVHLNDLYKFEEHSIKIIVSGISRASIGRIIKILSNQNRNVSVNLIAQNNICSRHIDIDKKRQFSKYAIIATPISKN